MTWPGDRRFAFSTMLRPIVFVSIGVIHSNDGNVTSEATLQSFFAKT
jgi:hypothetical protein